MVSALTRRVGQPSPTGTPWPSLPHVPGRPMAKSPAIMSMSRSTCGSVADQVALAQRHRDLAVLDEIGLEHAEHEVAGGRVDLAAAELGDVHAVVGGADDLLIVVGTTHHVGVRHPHHRQVAVALPPPVATERLALLACPNEVPHVVREHSVLDQHVALRGMTLVVEPDRAPLARHRPVVDQRDVGGGDLLADLAGVHTRPLGDGIGLQPVATCLVEQHAAATALDDDRHRPRGSRPGFKLRRRHPRCVAGQRLDVDAIERLEADGVTDRLEAGLHPGVAVGDDADARHAAGDRVVAQHTVGVGDENVLAAVGVRRRHLNDRLARRAGGFIDAPQQLDFGRLRHTTRIDLDGVDAVPRRLLEGRCHGAGSVAGRRRRCLGGGVEAALGQVTGVGVASRLAGKDANAGAAVAAAVDLLDATVVKAGRRRAFVLGVDLGEVAAGTHRRRQHSLEDVVVDHLGDATHRTEERRAAGPKSGLGENGRPPR